MRKCILLFALLEFGCSSARVVETKLELDPTQYTGEDILISEEEDSRKKVCVQWGVEFNQVITYEYRCVNVSTLRESLFQENK